MATGGAALEHRLYNADHNQDGGGAPTNDSFRNSTWAKSDGGTRLQDVSVTVLARVGLVPALSAKGL